MITFPVTVFGFQDNSDFSSFKFRIKHDLFLSTISVTLLLPSRNWLTFIVIDPLICVGHILDFYSVNNPPSTLVISSLLKKHSTNFMHLVVLESNLPPLDGASFVGAIMKAPRTIKSWVMPAVVPVTLSTCCST